jgi:hypothetical protein
MMPPSMASMAPLMNAASSDSRNAAAFATSSGRAVAPQGDVLRPLLVLLRRHEAFGRRGRHAAGAIALTRIPRGPSSPARTLVRPAMPALIVV